MIANIFQRADLNEQLLKAGDLAPMQVADAYDAMGVFAPGSKSGAQA